MSKWRREASDQLPELQSLIASPDIDNPMMLWIEINQKFDESCQQAPLPIDLLQRIWSYCKWCLGHRDANVRTAASVAFCEHLIDTPHRTQALPALITKTDYIELHELLLYHNSEESYQRWLLELWPS